MRALGFEGCACVETEVMLVDVVTAEVVVVRLEGPVELDETITLLVEVRLLLVAEVDDVIDDDAVELDDTAAPYVWLLNVRAYVLMSVAEWSPGAENSPTAKPISTVDPTPSVGKS